MLPAGRRNTYTSCLRIFSRCFAILIIIVVIRTLLLLLALGSDRYDLV
jgi:hypothetical protein